MAQHADELQELVDFLADPRPHVKKHAVELVEGLTGSADGVKALSSKAGSLAPKLLRLACAEPETSRSALHALVNLSGEAEIRGALLRAGLGSRALDWVTEGSCPHPDLLVGLLANATADEEGAAAVLLADDPVRRGVLLTRLLSGTSTPEHGASLAANVARLEAGREWLLEPGRGALRALADDLASPSESRRRGAASALRNVALGVGSDGPEAVGRLAEQDAVWRAALAALENNGGPGGDPGAAGGVLFNESQKRRLEAAGGERASSAATAEGPSSGRVGGGTGAYGERRPGAPASVDRAVRESLAEAVLALARLPATLELLWKIDAPSALGRAYEDEEDPAVCAALESTAEIFLQSGLAPEGARQAVPATGGGWGTQDDIGMAGGQDEGDGDDDLPIPRAAIPKPTFEELD